MAATDLQTLSQVPESDLQLIIDAQPSRSSGARVEFNPGRHLAYELPEEVIMMKDIGYSEDTGVSPVAVSQPFRLFTPDAVQVIRDQVLNEEVLKNCSYRSTIAPHQVRGYAAKYAPFVHDAWSHPETLDIISRIAGIELVPNMDLEIGHVNISVKSEQETKAELAVLERQKQGRIKDNEKPIVGWHTDSYPFVCVLMLSDCTKMVGGETALRTARGDVLKVRGPQMGCAVVLQGRYITHQALRALGAQERISMLYYEFGQYRLEILEERIRSQLKRLRDAHAAGRGTNTTALKAFLDEQQAFIKRTNDELVPDDEVIPGLQPELDFPDEQPAPALRVQAGLARAKLA